MESKLNLPSWLGILTRLLFNRTSMESKHVFAIGAGRFRVCSLLIEPVWNRNVFRASVFGCILALLIEPVWNRNFIR